MPKDVPLMVTENHLAAELTGPMTYDLRGAVAGRQCRIVLRGRRRSLLSLADPAAGHAEHLPGLGVVVELCVGRETTNINGYTSLYFAAHMINREWVQHRSGMHRMFPSSVDIKDGEGNALSLPTRCIVPMETGR